MDAHLHQRKLQTSPEEDELAVGTAEKSVYLYVQQHPAEKQSMSSCMIIDINPSA